MSNSVRFPLFPLPTFDRLGIQQPPSDSVDATKIVQEWFSSFTHHVSSNNIDGISSLFARESYWRDILSLTWDFRTFVGLDKIQQFLTDRLKLSQVNDLNLREDATLGLQRPGPDLAWIQFMFDFKVGTVGIGMGIGRLIPQSDGSWKCHCMFTNLDDLQNFLEEIGPRRDHEPSHGVWTKKREKEVAFEDREPVALIMGGGQSGLEIGARLKALGVENLIVEKHARVGDSWRNRYEALCLHDPVWYDHMPYLPFPPTWPVYSPSVKLAGWLESYAEFMELNVWTSSTVTNASFNEPTKDWKITIQFTDGKERVFNHVRHFIFCTGLAAGVPNMPSYPGMDNFKGQILHSIDHKRAADHTGKKVVVIGACTSAHDIASDYALNGVDVTMYQRGSTYIMSTKNGWKVIFEGLYTEDAPPVDLADRLNASFPNALLHSGLAQRQCQAIAELDKEILDGLTKCGFRTNFGIDDTGFGMLAWCKAGGYYLDVGASQMIIDGKIKLKNDSKLERFTETGLQFEDGSEISADVVLFATGYGDVRTFIRKICGDEVGAKCKPIWGLDEEGELQGTFRSLGVPGLWYIMGNLALDRFHTKHAALQIKAMEEGVFGTRYALNS
ncbi:FAD/NAD(P)-binding domain-containing protein [Marasmius fiardii PR-910]|nr:FAD/NAD(P)-binding domain-containing protein [Marasmius fiardii PR-910]